MRRVRLIGIVVVLALAVTAFVLSSIGVISAQSVFPYANPNPVLVDHSTTIYSGYNPTGVGYGQGFGYGNGYGYTTYAWTFTIPGCSNPGSVSQFVCTPNTVGQYTVQVSVTDSAGTISNQFTLQVNPVTVTFTETGLPVHSHAKWSASFQNDTQTVLQGDSIVFPVANGQTDYAFLVTGPAGWQGTTNVGNGEGSVGLPSQSSVVVTFARGPTYTLAFHEIGAKAGSTWCVSVSGGSFCTDKAREPLKDLTPNSYSYSVRTLGSATTLIEVGTAWTVASSGVATLAPSTAVQIRFAYPVTFTEHGLTGAYSWFVRSQGIEVTSSTDQIVLYLTNGTRAYAIVHEAGFKLTAPVVPHHVIVAGAPISVTVTYTPRP